VNPNRTMRARVAGPTLAFLALAGVLEAPAAAAAVPAAKSTRTAKSGLQMPADVFRQHIRTIALLPVVVPSARGGPSELRERYDSLYVKELADGGVHAITAQAWDIARQAVIDSAGPAIDAGTGKPDLAKARAVVKETQRRVAGRFGQFEAVLSSRIWRSPKGWILHVEIHDLSGDLLYMGDGVIVKVLPRSGAKGEPVGAPPLATTPRQDARAVAGARGPLSKALVPPHGVRARPAE
jgi:hypothetical protein